MHHIKPNGAQIATPIDARALHLALLEMIDNQTPLVGLEGMATITPSVAAVGHEALVRIVSQQEIILPSHSRR